MHWPNICQFWAFSEKLDKRGLAHTLVIGALCRCWYPSSWLVPFYWLALSLVVGAPSSGSRSLLWEHKGWCFLVHPALRIWIAFCSVQLRCYFTRHPLMSTRAWDRESNLVHWRIWIEGPGEARPPLGPIVFFSFPCSIGKIWPNNRSALLGLGATCFRNYWSTTEVTEDTASSEFWCHFHGIPFLVGPANPSEKSWIHPCWPS